MKRRTLDILFSLGGILLAGLLAVLALVLTSNANFAKNYVRDQLSAQKIQFKAADTLTDKEKAKPCVVKYAGQALTTGKQAECYANDFIGLHVADTAQGKTYAELGGVQSGLRTQVADAQKANDPKLTDLQKQLSDVTAQRETLFKGETLKGLLLTSFGFSEFGRKASQAATLLWLGAALMTLLSLFGFLHAFRTPKSVAFAPTLDEVREGRRELLKT